MVKTRRRKKSTCKVEDEGEKHNEVCGSAHKAYIHGKREQFLEKFEDKYTHNLSLLNLF